VVEVVVVVLVLALSVVEGSKIEVVVVVATGVFCPHPGSPAKTQNTRNKNIAINKTPKDFLMPA